MSQEELKQAIQDKKLICPKCKDPVQKYDNYIDLVGSVWDGAGDSGVEAEGSKVTLICGNGDCSWKERTEYWDSFEE
jgi:hypothetical protein